MKLVWLISGATILMALSAGAVAASNADIIKVRQARYREMGTAFKAVNDELRKARPVKFILTSSAGQIARLALEANGMFPAGSGPGAGVKTKAKPEIWQRPADFAVQRDRLVVEANKLAALSRGTDTAALAAQVRATGQVCTACHRAFREDLE